MFRRPATPVILQAEQTECGLASLTMIANFFGHRLDLATARRQCRVRDLGPSLRSILSMADGLGFVTRPIRLELAELGRLALPAILHWRFDHFVVVTRVRRHRVIIHDPAVGRRSLTRKEVSEAFTGVAVEFSRAADFAAESSSGVPVVRSLLRSFRGLARFLGLMLCLLLVSNTLALAPPIATQLLVDEVVLSQDRRWLYQVLGGIALVMLAMLVIDVLRRWISLYSGTRLATDSTAAVVSHLLHLPIETVLRRPVGDLLSRVDSLRPIRAALVDTALRGVVQLVVLVTTFAVMFVYSPRLTALSAGLLLLIAGLHAATLPKIRSLNMESVLASAQASNSLIESLRSYRSVRALGLDAERLAHWQRCFVAATNAGARQARLGITVSFGQGFLGGAEQLLFLAIGINGVISKQLTLGVLFAFMSLRGRSSAAAVQLVAATRELYLLRSHLQRVGELLGEKVEPPASGNAIRTRLNGAIACRQVSFAYAGGNSVIRRFDCSVSAGESVVIIGPSGTGKSTLLQLLSGSLQADGGAILVDGVELDLWDLRALRQQFGIVLQQDRLFHGSVAENISCFEIMPDLGRVREAASVANIWDEIVALPMKLRTPIAGSGSGLSGGQVQRILLARALYREPRILFLDEATSHLDSETESTVLDNLDALDLTIISVAHRDAARARGDRIIRLNSQQQ